MDKTVTVTRISINELEDLLSVMLEGASYWASYDWNSEDYKKAKEFAITHPTKYGISMEYVLSIMLMCDEKSIIICDFEEEDNYLLTYDKIIKGVEKAINGGFWDGVDLCDVDGEVGDVIMQYAIFDEIIYA